MRLGDLPTPQVLIDDRRLRRNIDRTQELAASAGLAFRPHAKTHKSPVIAKWQIDRGAVGICCAKLGEAEVFADAGIQNIRLPYPVNPANTPRVLALMSRATVSIIVDHLDVARAWSDAMRHAGRVLDVLIKVDVGFHRCGIEPGPTALDFVKAVDGMKGLRLLGFLSHAGHGYHARSEDELAAIACQEAEILTRLRDQSTQAGISIEEISVGATPTLRFSAKQPGLTELRPGNYVYFDRTQVALGAATLDDCALTVLATVVTKHNGRIILDCGSKTLTNDQARGITPAGGYGAVLQGEPGGTSGAGGSRESGGSSGSMRRIDTSLVIERLSEEHATVAIAGTPGYTSLEPGDRVLVLPNHACVVSNLVDVVRLVEDDWVIDSIPVMARGRIA
jgi:D-serine deaminase-like pyridoxal phosphate-dependent protein